MNFGLTFLGDAVVALVSLSLGVYFHNTLVTVWGKLVSVFQSAETLATKAKAEVATLETKLSAAKAAVKS